MHRQYTLPEGEPYFTSFFDGDCVSYTIFDSQTEMIEEEKRLSKIDNDYNQQMQEYIDSQIEEIEEERKMHDVIKKVLDDNFITDFRTVTTKISTLSETEMVECFEKFIELFDESPNLFDTDTVEHLISMITPKNTYDNRYTMKEIEKEYYPVAELGDYRSWESKEFGDESIITTFGDSHYSYSNEWLESIAKCPEDYDWVEMKKEEVTKMDKRLRITEAISINFDWVEVSGKIRFIWLNDDIVASFHAMEGDIKFRRKFDNFVQFELVAR